MESNTKGKKGRPEKHGNSIREKEKRQENKAGRSRSTRPFHSGGLLFWAFNGCFTFALKGDTNIFKPKIKENDDIPGLLRDAQNSAKENKQTK